MKGRVRRKGSGRLGIWEEGKEDRKGESEKRNVQDAS